MGDVAQERGAGLNRIGSTFILCRNMFGWCGGSGRAFTYCIGFRSRLPSSQARLNIFDAVDITRFIEEGDNPLFFFLLFVNYCFLFAISPNPFIRFSCLNLSLFVVV